MSISQLASDDFCEADERYKEPEYEDSLPLFAYQLEIEVLHIFIGYLLDSNWDSVLRFSAVQRLILSIARHDASIYRIKVAMGDSRRDSVVDHRQKMFHDSFASALPQDIDQLI